MMEIAGRRLILREEARPGEAEDLFHWLNLEEWNQHDAPDAPFVPISREEWRERLA